MFFFSLFFSSLSSVILNPLHSSSGISSSESFWDGSLRKGRGEGCRLVGKSEGEGSIWPSGERGGEEGRGCKSSREEQDSYCM